MKSSGGIVRLAWISVIVEDSKQQQGYRQLVLWQ
jgi:hypothetical protein